MLRRAAMASCDIATLGIGTRNQKRHRKTSAARYKALKIAMPVVLMLLGK